MATWGSCEDCKVFRYPAIHSTNVYSHLLWPARSWTLATQWSRKQGPVRTALPSEPRGGAHYRDTGCPLLSPRPSLTLSPSSTEAQLRLQDSGVGRPGRPRPFLSGEQPMRPRGWNLGPAEQAQPCAGSPASSSQEYQPMRTRGQPQGRPGNGKGRGVFRRSLLRPGRARAEEPTKPQPWQSRR